MIELQHLGKRYGDFTAVRDLSFLVGAGEVMGLVGPNGAGKTTRECICRRRGCRRRSGRRQAPARLHPR
ncbi:MAG: ATP-binding cassette domain-containing protein [Xanthomonadales bacterium]|nr:ATP-binding cassette domain-containing protein [Xanthomonadales bacterium]